MPNLTSVGVTNGIPNSGTGTVSTIDALMALIGEVAANPTSNTALDRLKAINTALVGTLTISGTVSINASQIGNMVTGDFAKTTPAVPVELPTDQAWKTGMSNKAFVAAFTTLTRPANAAAYAAADSISNNATAGSVTALTATVSDTNDDPIFINEILISSTDTGLAGKRIRAYLFNSDPTANSGVGGGDNAAYSQKVAGYIGSFSGVLETGFSDGTVGRLVPAYNDSATAPVPNAAAGGFVLVKPTSGAKTLFIQYQTLDAFTPSANSTTIIGTARGWQARAS